MFEEFNLIHIGCLAFATTLVISASRQIVERLSFVRGAAQQALAAALISYGTIVATGIALGWVGLLQWPIWHIGVSLLAGFVIVTVKKNHPKLSVGFPRLQPRYSRFNKLLYGLMIGLGVGATAFAFFCAWRSGLKASSDVMNYHIPLVFDWLQTGRISLGTNWQLPTAYYPHNSGLILAWIIAPVRQETLARLAFGPAWLFWGLTVYLTARLMGGRKQWSWACALLFLLTPVFLTSWGVTAMNDGFMAWTFLAGAYYILLFVRSGRVAPLLFAGLPIGLMVGTKGFAPIWLGVLIVIGLTGWIGLHVSKRSLAGFKKEIVTLMIVVAVIVALGGHWYLRNWMIRGNPAYPFEVKLGRWVLFDGISGSLMDRRVGWDLGHFLRYKEIGGFLGFPGFIAVFFLAVLGGFFGLYRAVMDPSRRYAALGVLLVVLTVLTYLFSPYTAIQPVGSLRRGFPAFAGIFILAALVPDPRRILTSLALIWAFRNLWHAGGGVTRFWPFFFAVAGGVSALCFFKTDSLIRGFHRFRRKSYGLLMGMILICFAIGGILTAQHTFRSKNRFAEGGIGFGEDIRGAFATGSRWVFEHLHNTRIEIIGDWRIMYMYGSGFSNRVFYGRYRPPMHETDGYYYGDKTTWLQFLLDNGVNYVFICSERNFNVNRCTDLMWEPEPLRFCVFIQQKWAEAMPDIFHPVKVVDKDVPVSLESEKTVKRRVLGIYRINRPALKRAGKSTKGKT